MTAAAPRTARHAEALAYIKGYIEKAGHSPTFDQIASGIGLNSKSGAFRIVHELEADGFLSRTGPAYRRVIEVITRLPAASDLARLSDVDLTTLSTRVAMEKARRGLA